MRFTEMHCIGNEAALVRRGQRQSNGFMVSDQSLVEIKIGDPITVSKPSPDLNDLNV